MSYFILGAAGTLAVLGLVSLGAFLGWKAQELFRQKALQEVDEEERRRIMEEQRAFSTMMSYNADTAYGLDGGAEDLFGGDNA